jgi:hypothetical protein
LEEEEEEEEEINYEKPNFGGHEVSYFSAQQVTVLPPSQNI